MSERLRADPMAVEHWRPIRIAAAKAAMEGRTLPDFKPMDWQKYAAQMAARCRRDAEEWDLIAQGSSHVRRATGETVA